MSGRKFVRAESSTHTAGRRLQRVRTCGRLMPDSRIRSAGLYWFEHNTLGVPKVGRMGLLNPSTSSGQVTATNDYAALVGGPVRTLRNCLAGEAHRSTDLEDDFGCGNTIFLTSQRE